MMHPPDEELVQRVLAGCRESFRLLLDRYWVRVYRICLHCAGNAEDAEDWAQECFVRIYQHIGTYNADLPFAPWLLRVTSNTCVSHARMRKRRRSRTALGLSEERTLSAAAADPLSRLLRAEEEGAALRALEALPSDLRMAVMLRVVEGLSFRELSEVLGVPLQTAATWVRRGLERVRRSTREAESAEPERRRTNR